MGVLVAGIVHERGGEPVAGVFGVVTVEVADAVGGGVVAVPTEVFLNGSFGGSFGRESDKRNEVLTREKYDRTFGRHDDENAP